jgi:hypothetical protein
LGFLSDVALLYLVNMKGLHSTSTVQKLILMIASDSVTSFLPFFEDTENAFNKHYSRFAEENKKLQCVLAVAGLLNQVDSC